MEKNIEPNEKILKRKEDEWEEIGGLRMVGRAENMFKMHSTKFSKNKKYFYRGGCFFMEHFLVRFFDFKAGFELSRCECSELGLSLQCSLCWRDNMKKACLLVRKGLRSEKAIQMFVCP